MFKCFMFLNTRYVLRAIFSFVPKEYTFLCRKFVLVTGGFYVYKKSLKRSVPYVFYLILTIVNLWYT